jgi:hypothetical protein
LLKFAVRLGMAPDYELAPAALTGGACGGYRNTSIPNHIYRWTERVVESTVNSYLPAFTHSFSYYYGYRIPTQRLAMSPKRWKRLLGKSAEIFVPIVEKLIPKQGNEFAFLVSKRESLQPWITEKDGEPRPDIDYLQEAFRTEKYKKM